MSARSLCCLAALCGLMITARGAVAAITTNDTTHDFARYQIILDHAPFGAMAGPSTDIKQPGFSERFTFVGTAKLSDDEPLLAIILDKEGNHVYFKGEGESVGAATVLKIEKDPKAPANTKLVLKQGLEVATLVMDGKGAGAGAPPGSPGVPGQPPQPGQPAQPGQPPIPGQPGIRRVPFRRGG
jgi:hypothetical protein